MERELVAAGRRDQFVITGFVPHATVAAALGLVDVVVMPSIHEELGGTAVEALLLGTPLAAYAVGGLRTTVGSIAPDLLVAPGDVEALAALVRRVLSDRSGVAARLDASRDTTASAFDADAACARMLACYRGVGAAASA
jgi:2-deoxystreptamine N-acetyl-D-glucosaminyltransferase/2-deoxystreptamine glucosyltransferase